MTSSNENNFRVNGPLSDESTIQLWIPLTRASDAELWCLPWCSPDQANEQTIETPVIWDTITVVLTLLLSIDLIKCWFACHTEMNPNVEQQLSGWNKGYTVVF